MNRRTLFKRYLFSVSVILCFLAFFAGIVTVSERTRYNMDMSPYSKITYNKTASGAEIVIGEKHFLIGKEFTDKIGEGLLYGIIGDIFDDRGENFVKNAN